MSTITINPRGVAAAAATAVALLGSAAAAPAQAHQGHESRPGSVRCESGKVAIRFGTNRICVPPLRGARGAEPKVAPKRPARAKRIAKRDRGAVRARSSATTFYISDARSEFNGCTEWRQDSYRRWYYVCFYSHYGSDGRYTAWDDDYYYWNGSRAVFTARRTCYNGGGCYWYYP